MDPIVSCVVTGCGWGDDGKGNVVGKPMCGQGGWQPECRVNWMSADPEDLEPYDEYLRDLGKWYEGSPGGGGSSQDVRHSSHG